MAISGRQRRSGWRPLATRRAPRGAVALCRPAVAAAGRLLDALAEAYPASLPKYELAAACRLEVSGGTFLTYLSRLSGNGLITRDCDQIRASDDLFT